jgi:hypothetical protein
MNWNSGLRRTAEYWRSVGLKSPRRIPPGPQSPLAGDNNWPNGLLPRLRGLQRRTRTGGRRNA